MLPSHGELLFLTDYTLLILHERVSVFKRKREIDRESDIESYCLGTHLCMCVSIELK